MCLLTIVVAVFVLIFMLKCIYLFIGMVFTGWMGDFCGNYRWQQTYHVNAKFSDMCEGSEIPKQLKFTFYFLLPKSVPQSLILLFLFVKGVVQSHFI